MPPPEEIKPLLDEAYREWAKLNVAMQISINVHKAEPAAIPPVETAPAAKPQAASKRGRKPVKKPPCFGDAEIRPVCDQEGLSSRCAAAAQCLEALGEKGSRVPSPSASDTPG